MSQIEGKIVLGKFEIFPHIYALFCRDRHLLTFLTLFALGGGITGASRLLLTPTGTLRTSWA